MPTTNKYDRKYLSFIYGTLFDSGTDSGAVTRSVVNMTSYKSFGATLPYNWRWRIRNHYETSTSLLAENVSCDVIPGDLFAIWGSGSNRNTTYARGELWTPLFPSAANYPSVSVMSRLKKEVSIKLILQARNKRTQLQTLVSLGEFGETLRMLRNPAKALFSGMFDYLSAARRRAAKVKRRNRKKVLQDTWLEYQYGWAPLVSDIEGAYDALHKLPTSRTARLRASATSPLSATVSTGSSSVGNISCKQEIRDTVTASVRAYGCVMVDMQKPGTSLARWGLATSEFLPTVWELIPYSFIADYFTNIGDVIAASSFPVSLMPYTGMTTEEVLSKTSKRTFSESGTKANISGYKSGGGYGGSATGRLRRVTRQNAIQQISLSLNNLQFEIPGLGRKWLNLAALATAHNSAASRIRS